MDREAAGAGVMKQEWSMWGAGLSIGGAAGAGLWVVIDTMIAGGALGLGLSVGVAFAIASIWTASRQKRRSRLAAEAAALVEAPPSVETRLTLTAAFPAINKHRHVPR
jgi:hypothetical protein